MTLWTPGGEHHVPREPQPERPAAAASETDAAAGEMPLNLDDLDPEERERAEAIMAELAAARERLAAAPPEAVVANHAMGLYELAAIHLTADPPRPAEARLAIDAMGLLVEGLAGRLGESEATLREALQSLRMGYVQQTSGDASDAA
ncbi:MAG: hypothetical protein F4078_10540 [Acidimicrobiia bacterium]|nr:hypothetical protein [Acidimicrobiia bacterium]